MYFTAVHTEYLSHLKYRDVKVQAVNANDVPSGPKSRPRSRSAHLYVVTSSIDGRVHCSQLVDRDAEFDVDRVAVISTRDSVTLRATTGSCGSSGRS